MARVVMGVAWATANAAANAAAKANGRRYCSSPAVAAALPAAGVAAAVAAVSDVAVAAVAAAAAVDEWYRMMTTVHDLLTPLDYCRWWHQHPHRHCLQNWSPFARRHPPSPL